MDVGTSLQFLAFVVLVMAMAQTHEVDTLDLYLWGLRISAILACIIAAIQVLVLHQVRAKGGMANPIPFSNVALLAGALSLIGLERLRPWQRLVALVAAFVVAATLLSQTRGALIAVPLAVSGSSDSEPPAHHRPMEGKRCLCRSGDRRLRSSLRRRQAA